MHDAGGKREPLLPATRQRAGELVLARGEAETFEGLVDGTGKVFEVVEPCHEGEVLADRQVLVEGEALRHVADVALDRLRLGEDVVAEAGPVTAIGVKQPADHADGGGLA